MAEFLKEQTVQRVGSTRLVWQRDASSELNRPLFVLDIFLSDGGRPFHRTAWENQQILAYQAVQFL